MIALILYIISALCLIYQDKTYRRLESGFVLFNIAISYLMLITFKGSSIFILLLFAILFLYHIKFSEDKRIPKLVDVVYFIKTAYLIILARIMGITFKWLFIAILIPVLIFLYFNKHRKDDFVPYLTVILPADIILMSYIVLKNILFY